MFEIGDRVQSNDGFRGTIRFFGKLEGSADEWVGVEWDSDGRGKHDGCHQGQRYFSCPTGRGSFVRPENVLVKPTTLQNAIVLKYVSSDAADFDESMSFREAGKKKAAVVCEFVGKEREIARMANLELLKEVTLPCALIDQAGDLNWLKDHVSAIGSLELEDNLIRRWTVVADFASQLPALTSLSLSGNMLDPPTDEDFLKFPTAFLNLKKLVLNCTGVTVAQLDRIVRHMTALSDLHIASNRLDSFTPDEDGSLFHGWPSLRLIDISDNALDWPQLAKLARLGSLQRLVANSNHVAGIDLPPDLLGGFSSLTALAAAHNRLASWSSVAALRGLPALAELRLQSNPFCDSLAPAAARQLLVASLPALTVVNGGEVRPRERADAERFYLRHALATADSPLYPAAPGAPAPAGSSADRLQQLAGRDPVLAALLAKHGPPPEPAAGTAAGGGTVGASLVEATLRSMAASSSHKPAATRKVPAGVTVANLKRMCQQLFGLDTSRQRLFFHALEEGGEGGARLDAWDGQALDDDMRPLSFYLGAGGGAVEIWMQEAEA